MPDSAVSPHASFESTPGHVFCHQAMASRFRMHVIDQDVRYAQQAANSAFETLDTLDRLLSRFIESSDVSRINRLSAGKTTVVAVETLECLSLAQQVKRWTEGAFDVAYASQPNTTSRESNSHAAARDRFHLDRETCSVQVHDDDVQIDLGGIGKGFALDRIAANLREWGIGHALLWASTSTVYAMGHPPDESGWRVHLSDAKSRRSLELRNTACSASGNAVRGPHIVDPATGVLAHGGRRVWVSAASAALADALSTAMMVMDEQQTRQCCARLPRVHVF